MWEGRCITRQVQIQILKLNYSKTTNIYTMGLCVLYYVEYSLYNVKKVGFFYLGWNYTLSISINLFPQICRYLSEVHLIGWMIWFSQWEVVFNQYMLEILKNETKNMSKNGWWTHTLLLLTGWNESFSYQKKYHVIWYNRIWKMRMPCGWTLKGKSQMTRIWRR